jgi:phosphotransacetylase
MDKVSHSMPLPRLAELHSRADSRKEPVCIAVAGGDDPTVLQALRLAVDRGWVRPIVFGSENEVRNCAASLGITLDGMDLRHADEQEIAPAVVAEVRGGRASALMKGQIAMPALLEAVLDPEAGLRTGRVICQVVLMEIPRDDRRFLLADMGINIHPSLEKKAGILKSTVEVAHALGVTRPRVALMAATEAIKAEMPETLHARELTRLYEDQGEFDCLVQGPLSFDLAYAADAGARKHIGGLVVGAADIMIFPDLLSANLTVKAIMYTADSHFGGVLHGASAPVVFMSRADDVPTRLNSLALALAIFERRK